MGGVNVKSVGIVREPPAEDCKKAALTVVEAAHGAEDARLLLDILGLIPKKEEEDE